MVVLLAVLVAGPWSLVDLALASIAGLAAGPGTAISARASGEVGPAASHRIRRPTPLAQDWRVEPLGVVAEQDEPVDLTDHATAGWWTMLRADGPGLHLPLVGRAWTTESVGHSIPRAPTRIRLRC
jgi:hypothetical protein